MTLVSSRFQRHNPNRDSTYAILVDVTTNGTLLIDKPAGMTSFGVVARIRRVLSEQAGHKVKVGHTGTLDPFATGLMILTIGAECKNAERYSKLDKVYEAVFQIGQTSSTGDTEGDITDVSAKQPTSSELQQVISQFTGEITQRPPVFSAIKIGGQRAYKLARSGQKVDMPERKVQVYELELLNYTYPLVSIRAHVSSGTYIRSLAVDMGEALGVGAYCQGLRRTSINEWSVADAQSLADFGIMD